MTAPVSASARASRSNDQRTGDPIFYCGPAVVAGWLGVSRAALGNWLRRYSDFPEAAAIIIGPKRDSWCWRPEQREDWIRWAEGKDVAVGYERAYGEAGLARSVASHD